MIKHQLKVFIKLLDLSVSRPFQIVMLRNEVCECRASGVFLRLSAQGLIAENNIHSNGEAGLDIRKGANPIIVVNYIVFVYIVHIFKLINTYI